jgi:hypothetical protein
VLGDARVRYQVDRALGRRAHTVRVSNGLPRQIGLSCHVAAAARSARRRGRSPERKGRSLDAMDAICAGTIEVGGGDEGEPDARSWRGGYARGRGGRSRSGRGARSAEGEY